MDRNQHKVSVEYFLDTTIGTYKEDGFKYVMELTEEEDEATAFLVTITNEHNSNKICCVLKADDEAVSIQTDEGDFVEVEREDFFAILFVGQFSQEQNQQPPLEGANRDLHEIANYIDNLGEVFDPGGTIYTIRGMLDKAMIADHVRQSFAHGHAKIIDSPGPEKRFYTMLVAENGEPLTTSELLNGHATAVNNILAQLNLFGGEKVKVIDRTEDKEFILHANGDTFYQLSDKK